MIDVAELNTLDVTIIRFVYPRLLAFRDHCHNRIPDDIVDDFESYDAARDEWIIIIDSIIAACKFRLSDEYYNMLLSTDEWDKNLVADHKQALELFGKYLLEFYL